jgi:hypothetical protein
MFLHALPPWETFSTYVAVLVESFGETATEMATVGEEIITLDEQDQSLDILIQQQQYDKLSSFSDILIKLFNQLSRPSSCTLPISNLNSSLEMPRLKIMSLLLIPRQEGM